MSCYLCGTLTCCTSQRIAKSLLTTRYFDIADTVANYCYFDRSWSVVKRRWKKYNASPSHQQFVHWREYIDIGRILTSDNPFTGQYNIECIIMGLWLINHPAKRSYRKPNQHCQCLPIRQHVLRLIDMNVRADIISRTPLAITVGPLANNRLIRTSHTDIDEGEPRMLVSELPLITKLDEHSTNTKSKHNNDDHDCVGAHVAAIHIGRHMDSLDKRIESELDDNYEFEIRNDYPFVSLDDLSSTEGDYDEGIDFDQLF